MIPIPRDQVPFDGCESCGQRRAQCACVDVVAEVEGERRKHAGGPTLIQQMAAALKRIPSMSDPNVRCVVRLRHLDDLPEVTD